MAIQEKLATGQGKFTPRYPELGTGPVSYDDAVSEEFFLAEREAVFKRSWLKVGRIDQLPRVGSYFTRELVGLGSIVIVKQADGTVKALHNVCAHRGNKVVWQEHPAEETKGSCKAFTCKYHGWRYGLDGKVDHVTNEDQFFDLDKGSLGMPELHCDTWAGFIFVNFDPHAQPLRSFLGEKFTAVESYPFEKMTEHYGYKTKVKGNWKLSIDTILEWYHPPYVHGRFIDRDVSKAEKLVPPPDSYYYDLFTSHMLNSVPGPPQLPPRKPGELGPAQRNQRWIYKLLRAGLFGPDDVQDIGPLPDVLNPGNIKSWGNDAYWLFPNFSVQIWARNFYITYQYWPETVGEHSYELDIYFPPPRNAAERLAQEMTAQTTIEFAMQDSNTVEATHSALATGANREFHLSDQELMIRNFHKVVRDTVTTHQNLSSK